jgi:hypothetical protein
MKQRITIEQLNELTNEQKEKLRNWWWGSNPGMSDVYVVKHKYDDITRYEGPHLLAVRNNFSEDYHKGEAIPLLSIGQMFEFHKIYADSVGRIEEDLMFISSDIEIWRIVDLCDLLWEELKRVL